jgi:uncharacterized protein YgfB (UPF0149 family)
MNSAFDPEGLSLALEPCRRAGCHALLCGSLVAGGSTCDAAQYVSALEPELGTHTLQAWAQTVHAQLEAPDFSFRLGVPDDDAALAVRVDALTAWAHEFLSALGQAGKRLSTLDAEARDTLRELEAIGQGATVGESDTEAEELMYAELVEHGRLSVLLLYEMLNHPAPSVAQ